MFDLLDLALAISWGGILAKVSLMRSAIKARLWDLFRCRCLRGLKGLPCIPSALPILFRGPTLRFQEMKIVR